jgi:hypothetical protein
MAGSGKPGTRGRTSLISLYPAFYMDHPGIWTYPRDETLRLCERKGEEGMGGSKLRAVISIRSISQTRCIHLVPEVQLLQVTWNILWLDVRIRVNRLSLHITATTAFLTEHHAMKAYWGSGDIAPRILVLGSTWR